MSASFLMTDSGFDVCGFGSHIPLLPLHPQRSAGAGTGPGLEGEDPLNDGHLYRYRIFPVRAAYGTLSLSPIHRLPNGTYRMHLMTSDHTLQTTRADMAPDYTPGLRKVILQTNLLHHYGLTTTVMGMQETHPISRMKKLYLNVADFGKVDGSSEKTFFDLAQRIDELLLDFVKVPDNYRFLTGYNVTDETVMTTRTAAYYLKRAFTTYGKVKRETPTPGCSFSFLFHHQPDGTPNVGVFHRSVPKRFHTMTELLELIPQGKLVKLILKPTIYLTPNYEGLDEASIRLYRHEGIPTFSIQVIYQVCTINVDMPA